MKFEETLDKIIKTEFFDMLKLSLKWKHLFEKNANTLSESERNEQALKHLLSEEAFISQNLSNVLEKANITLGKHLKLFCVLCREKSSNP